MHGFQKRVSESMLIFVAHINPHNFSRIIDLLSFKYFYFIHTLCVQCGSTTLSLESSVHDNQYTQAYVVCAVSSPMEYLVVHFYLFYYHVHFSSQSDPSNSFVGYYEM